MGTKSNRAPSKKLERVIFLWSVPANGHLNPTLCFTNQLLTRLDELNIAKIVFYSGASFKSLILNLPNNKGKNRIEFRDYGLTKHIGTENLLKVLMNFDTRPGTLFRAFQCFENSVKLGSKHLFKNLLEDMYTHRPALIIYDQALFFPKLAFDLYAKKYNRPKPLHACYVTTFMCAKGIYPYWSELGKMGLLGNTQHFHNKIRTLAIMLYDFCKYVYTYYKTLWWDLGFTLFDLFLKCDLPISKYQLIDDNLNIVFVLPDMQPRLEFFQKPNIKFVGPSVDESVRKTVLKEKFDMDKYVEIIDRFLEKQMLKNYNESSRSSGEAASSRLTGENFTSILRRSDSTGENFKKHFRPIIYVSMGTVFNNENSHLFQVLVEACTHFAGKHAIIVSTGDEKTYKKYANTFLNSDQILMVPHTPQVEILKRAHLFITHAGMNSVSEAVNYGVPIICLPLSGDQPFVAWRVADELNLGIRLQPDETLTVDRVTQAISTILSDSSYRQRAQQFSKISKQYAGHVEACNLTVKLIKENEARKKVLQYVGDPLAGARDEHLSVKTNLIKVSSCVNATKLKSNSNKVYIDDEGEGDKEEEDEEDDDGVSNNKSTLLENKAKISLYDEKVDSKNRKKSKKKKFSLNLSKNK